MTIKIFRPAAAALFAASTLMAPAALAQETTAAGTTMGQSWDASLADTFFAPGGAGTLRSDAEIRSNWQSLSAEQKQRVRDDCAAFGSGTAGTAEGADAGETTASGGSTPGNASSMSGGASVQPGSNASPGTSEHAVTATEQQAAGQTGTTSPGSDAQTGGANTAGSGATAAGTGNAGSGAAGGSFQASTVSLSSWTQICKMVGEF